MSESAEVVIVSRRGRVGHLELNRPRSINALTSEMVGMLLNALDDWRTDDAVETVVLTGAGDRGLCAGGDIVSIYRDAVAGGTASERFWREEYRLNSIIATYPKPFVAIQSGIVLGGGIGVSAHGSVRAVTETSTLGMPETTIGFVPDVGGTYLLAHAPGELGTHLALTSGTVGAADAILVGLADFFIPSTRIEAFLEALETDAVTTVLPRFVEQPPPSELGSQRSWIDEAYAGDDLSTIVERLGAIDDENARAAAASVSTKSPTALEATLASLRRAATLPDLDAVLRQELRVSLRMLREPDVAEGIRAQVIDKDRSPRWSPASIAEVDPARIRALFDPLDHELSLTTKENP